MSSIQCSTAVAFCCGRIVLITEAARGYWVAELQSFGL